jgi:itaconate CoA-transferase
MHEVTRRPLQDVLVVGVEQAVSGPFATRALADLGARVIKIERPGEGDFARHYDNAVRGMASHFVWLNRNKESVALDLRDEVARTAVERLLTRADVLIQNLGPGAAARLGLAADQVVQRHPRLIACDMSGFGSAGPYAQKRAYDLVVQAETGSIAITGWPERFAKPGIPLADIAAATYVVSAVLAALYDRERTGEGTAISVSMFDAVAEWMGYSIYHSAYTGRDHVPNGIGHPSLCPYNGYPTADGQLITMAVQNDREWRRLCIEVLKAPELADDPDLSTNSQRVAHRERVDQMCAAVFASMSLAAAAQLLDTANIANGKVNSVSELLGHAQLAERGRWGTVDSPVGEIHALLPPADASAWGARLDPVPSVGQHTCTVLAELGLAPEEIDHLAGACERDGRRNGP